MSRKEKKNNKAKFSILPKSTGLAIVALIILMIEAVFIFFMAMLDILPGKYTALILGVILIVDIIIFLLMKGREKKKKSKKPIVGVILAVLLIGIMGVGSVYLYNTFEIFQKISEYKAQWEDYYVTVEADSSYTSSEELNGKTVYVQKSESKMYKEAKERLTTKADVKYKEVDSADKLCGQLTDSGSKTGNDIILVSRTNYEMYCEKHENYKDGTKIIDTITVEVKTDDFADRINVTEDPFIVYITGNDQWGELEGVSRSDVNMVMAVHPANREILLVSIPRDSYVKLHSYGAYDKLTHSGIYGVDETISTVEDWMGIDINYYFRVNFTMLIRLINALGGIDVESEFDFKSSVKDYTYKKGMNHLNGMEALYFVRERKAFEDMDMERGRNQQRMLKALVDKVTSSKVILTKYTKILDAIDGCMQTNMSNKDISSLVKMQIKDMRGWTVKSIDIDGTTGMQPTYSMGSVKLSTVIPYQDDVDKAKKAIHTLMYPAENNEAAEKAKQEIEAESK